MNSMHRIITALTRLDREDKDFDDKFDALQSTAQELLALLAPQNDGPTVYVAGPMECLESRDFTLGPAPAIWELGEIPDGHVIAAMTPDGEICDRAIVIDGVANWTKLTEEERRQTADDFYEEADLGVVIDDSGWRTESNESMSKTVFCDDGGESSVKRTLTIVFAPKSAVITNALFDGEELPPPDLSGTPETLAP
jgi:hypothetical protein